MARTKGLKDFDLVVAHIPITPPIKIIGTYWNGGKILAMYINKYGLERGMLFHYKGRVYSLDPDLFDDFVFEQDEHFKKLRARQKTKKKK